MQNKDGLELDAMLRMTEYLAQSAQEQGLIELERLYRKAVDTMAQYSYGLRIPVPAHSDRLTN